MLALLLLLVNMNDDYGMFSMQADLWYRQLLADSGYGALQREHAAFLIRESDGTLTLAPWPERGFRHASYRGAMPQRVIAILHTHPRHEPRPSTHDRAEARRLGMPVVAITTEAVIAAMPDGREVAITAAKTPARASRTTRAPSAPRTCLRR